MIEDSLKSGTPIALGFVDQPENSYAVEYGENLSFVRSIAGYGKPVVVERREDGTLLIFLQAMGKAKLGALQKTGTPYLVVDAETIEEVKKIPTGQMSQLLTLQKLLSNWVNKNIPDQDVRNQFLDQLRAPDEVVSSCASFLLQDPDLQQAVLEEDTLEGKINLLSGLLASGISI